MLKVSKPIFILNMNKITKLVTLTVLILLLISQIFIISGQLSSTSYEESGLTGTNTQETANNTNKQNVISPQKKYYPVLCEIGTATWCKYCPELEEKIYDIYDQGKYPIYLVSLVYDKSQSAKKRLERDYSIYGFPTLFVDGGREVIYGSDVGKSEIEKKIKTVAEKPKKNISIDIDVNLKDNESLYLKIEIRNNESSDYSGRLKVYLVEINSRWYDYEGRPYRYALLDFVLDRKVYIDFGEKEVITCTWKIGDNLKPINRENLMVIVTLFSEESKKMYSDPPENKKSFDAHYLDALAVKKLGEGNLPPHIGIAQPKKGMFHFRSKPLFKTLSRKTVVFGKTYLKFVVRDDGRYVKIRIYVDGKLHRIIVDNNFGGEKEYQFKLPPLLIGRHTITIEVYDEEGEGGKESMEILSFLLFR